jgi:DNA-binding NarL/FixJ family response regulator
MAAEGKLRVLVVDDQEIVTWGFRLVLSREPWVERCLTASTEAQAVTYARRFQPHVLLIDVFLGERSGIETCDRIREVSPHTRMLLMSGVGRVSAKAVRLAGAAGFVSKGWRPDDLARAVRMVGLGLTLTAPEDPDPVVSQLSIREREILRGIAEGKTNAEIAVAMSLSQHTVKQHASKIFRKLGVHNRTEAVRRGERLGYID